MQQVKMVSLDEVLAYENVDVVYRFQKVYGVSTEESSDIFSQVKRWMWLAHTRKIEGIATGLSIDPPLVVIDEMWHNFILFTVEYHEFCDKYFGYYIHHGPATEGEDREFYAMKDTTPIGELRKKVMDSKRAQYEYVYDKLGKDIFQKWYVTYPKKYTPVFLAESQFRVMEETFNKAKLLRQQAISLQTEPEPALAA